MIKYLVVHMYLLNWFTAYGASGRINAWLTEPGRRTDGIILVSRNTCIYSLIRISGTAWIFDLAPCPGLRRIEKGNTLDRLPGARGGHGLRGMALPDGKPLGRVGGQHGGRLARRCRADVCCT